MSESKQNNKYTYAYKDIVTLEFSFTEHSFSIEKLVEKLRLDFETSFRFNNETETVSFDLDINAISEMKGEDDEEKLIERECFNIRLRNLFFVENLEIHVTEGNIKQDENFLVLIASLSYSSARGVLNEKLSNTRYGDKFLLPVIDPKNFVSKKPKDKNK